MKQRVIGVLLSVVLVILLIPALQMPVKAGAPSEWDALVRAMAGEAQESVAGAFDIMEDAGVRTIFLRKDFVGSEGSSGLVVPEGKNIVLRMEDHTIDRKVGDTAIPNGSVITVETGADLKIVGTGIVTGGNTTGNGGGILNRGTFTAYRITIQGNKAVSGGGIANESGTISLNYLGNVVSQNTATGDGGGVYNTGTGSVSLSSVTMELNTAGSRGGAIFTQGSGTYPAGLVEFNGTIKDCSAPNGGAAYVSSTGRLELLGGTIDHGQASVNGGGVYVEYNEEALLGVVTLANNATIKNCTAAADGGAIYSKGSIGLENATISSNAVTTGNGGGIYLGENGSIFLGSTGKVTGNTKGTANNNLYISSKSGIVKFGSGEDTKTPATGMNVGVTMEVAPTKTKNAVVTSNGTKNYMTYLSSDNPDYGVMFVTDHLELAVAHTHDAELEAFQPWDKTDSLPTTAGNWYLTKDITLASKCTVSGAKVNLCLNGHVITLTGAESYIWLISNADYTISDCSETVHKFRVEDSGLWVLDEDNGTEELVGGCITGSPSADVIFANASSLTLESGNIVGNVGSRGMGIVSAYNGTFTMNGGSIIGNTCSDYYASIVHPYDTGSFEMNGGSISYNTVKGGSSTEQAALILVGDSAKFHLNDGEIIGNDCSSYGRVIYNDGYSGTASEFVMAGGTISYNSCYENISLKSSSPRNVFIGGSITNNNATKENGAGIYFGSNENLYIGGTLKVTGNVYNGTLDRTAKTLTGGTKNGVYSLSNATFHIGEGSGEGLNGVAVPASGMMVEVDRDSDGAITDNGTAEDVSRFATCSVGQYLSYNSSGYLELKFKQYTITYKDQGDAAFSGTQESDAPTTHTYGTATELKDATKEGFTFDGWFTASDCTGDAVTGLGATEYTADITLYAKWTEEVHVHNLVKVTGQAPTETASGWKDYFECKNSVDACGAWFEDAEGTTPITDLTAWKAEGGKGYLAPLPAPADFVVEYSGNTIEDAKTDAGKITVDGLDKIADKETPESGKKITIKLEIEPQKDAVTAEQKELEKLAGSAKKAEFLELTLLKQINSEEPTDIGGTNTQVLTIDIPFDFSKVLQSSIAVYRYHGSAEALKKDPGEGEEGFVVDKTNGKITIKAYKFSTYSIVYEEITTPPTGDTSNTTLWAVLLLISGATLAGTIVYSRKKKEEI